MSIIVPHEIAIRRHTDVPYLWKVRCSCGWYALAPDAAKARMAGNSHLSEEEPFPTYLFDEGEPNGPTNG